MWLLLVFGATLLCSIEARRIRVRPLPQDPEQEEETIQYYAAAEPRDGPEHGVVYVSAADQYNGLYGQPTASPRHSHDNYIPSGRVTASQIKAARVKESPKAPPVQTIRNYNKVNDDGSFTFGYEAADGSFKEETRGTDCVVRGKYGYIDPDGNKREFTYVSGNPCDPNAPKEEELPEEDSKEPENVPANYPTRPIRPLRPVTPPPKPVTLFHNDYQQQEEDVQPEPEQLLKPQSFPARPQYLPRPQLFQRPEEIPQSYQRPRLLPSTTPSSVLYKQSITPVNITPRPVTQPTVETELPPTTYRPQLLQVAVTPRPSLLYTKEISVTPRPALLPSTVSPVPVSVTRGSLDFESEFQRFQHDNNLISPSPSPVSIPKPTPKITKPVPSSTAAPAASGGQVYSSELVYDPSTGLYNTQLYQTLPQTEGDFSLNHRIQPYVHQPHAQLLNIQQLQQQSPLYRTIRPQPTQAVYQQQQAELQFQNSAQLYAQQQQQQKVRAQQVQPARPQPKAQPQQPAQPQPQQYYYIQPSALQQPHALVGGGQIDAFLRGQTLSF
ncbi:hypothetical protein ILUMI_03309 [Ignelater luminosus]|uniref:Uncharacterized protein n=1 Tax=Ignelater luminosus TaxID=2038154 RepID=A0A8K0GIG0_IGNLU|nr:hypothetical protein ILUMI_03309 [Ignelater luminosus]